ncbi:MAG: transcriptional repressor [Pseudomonadota bacterium]|nr:MAG: transcriptional repressor [Pseudomonadota bacterium]
MSDSLKNQTLTKDEGIALLKAHDVTPTQQRVDIARILFARSQHMSAEQVMLAANRAGADVSKATVYNTLGLFAGKGMVRQVIVDSAKVFYDSNTSPHFHFYNVDTGKLTDVDERQVNITRLPTLPDGTVTDGVDVIIRVRQDKS